MSARRDPWKVGTDSPDVAFVAFAARYAPALAAFNAYAGPDGTPEDEALRTEMVGIFEICMAAKPRTLAGLAAKARLVLVEARMGDGSEMPPEQRADEMARAIVHDLIRLAGAGT